jgi:isocitrate/isopropylmalate dehydrogenase
MASRPYHLVLLPGDGVGVEVIAQARRVLDEVAGRSGASFEIDEIPCGAQYFLDHGLDWPEGSEKKCRDADAILLGAIGWPAKGCGTIMRPDGKMAGWSAIVGNRVLLDLYANIRPVKLFPGVKHLVSGEHKQVWHPENVDMVFLRENTEDLYAGSGGILAPGGRAEVATDTRIVTRASSERIIRLAFETAMKRQGAPKDGVKRVTCVVKDNILHGCRFFLSIFERIGEDYPEVERDVILVDAFTQWLLRQPEYYNVVVTMNMFGDIITELASALQGGMGMSVGCNVGERHGMFEPIHGSAPKHAGKDRVNPMATVLALAETLKWLGERHCDELLTRGGEAVEAAVREVIRNGETLTYDLVGDRRAASMSQVTTAILDELKHSPLLRPS